MITSQKKGNLLILLPEPSNLDAGNADQFRKEIQKAFEEGEKHLAFDFSSVDYISSAGIRVIAETFNHIRQIQGSACLICPSKRPVLEILELTGLHLMIPIFETIEEAVEKSA